MAIAIDQEDEYIVPPEDQDTSQGGTIIATYILNWFGWGLQEYLEMLMDWKNLDYEGAKDYYFENYRVEIVEESFIRIITR